jgi:GTPase SAR1 family protein
MGGARDGGSKVGGGGGGKGGTQFLDWRCTFAGCTFRNYGWRTRCLRCEALPPAGARVPKGSGKGGGDGVGGIASRQLQQAEAARRDQQRALDRVRNERNDEISKLRKELAEVKRQQAAAAGATVVDIAADDDAAEQEDTDDGKEELLVGEIKSLEALVKGLPEEVLFRSTTQRRIDDAKNELQEIRERKGGPGAKVILVAGKHQKELRTARTKLLKRTKAQEKLEGEVDELEDKLKGLREQLVAKQSELCKTKEEVQAAREELQRLTRASAEEDDAASGGAAKDGAQLGNQDVGQLLERLAQALPPTANAVLAGLRQEAAQYQAQLQAQQEQLRQQQAAAADAAASAAGAVPAAPAPPPQSQQPQPPGPPLLVQDGDDLGVDDMDDLDEKTVELLGVADAVLDAAAEGGLLAAEATAGGSNRRRAALVDHLKRRGTASTSLQGVIKDLKNKKSKAEARAAAAAAAAAAKAAAGADKEGAPQA